MALATLSISEDYWDDFKFKDSDLDFLYHHLIELETPQSPEELTLLLIENRLKEEKELANQSMGKDVKNYLPKNSYEVGDKIIISSINSELGKVVNVRDGLIYQDPKFKVVEVSFEDGTKREFAAELEEHKLNQPVIIDRDNPLLSPPAIFKNHGNAITKQLTKMLSANSDFVYIAGRWFPKELLVEVNEGNLNLAEAVLDVAAGNPLDTEEILKEVGLPSGVNNKLAGFSLALAMQEDPRFDEVGPEGEVAWFIKKLEPPEVQETPLFLEYQPIEYDQEALNDQMLQLEKLLDDELSPDSSDENGAEEEIELGLIFPHWRVGSLPMSERLSRFFPTAYESPRVRFILVDAKTGNKFPGWVVRLERYIFGLRDWYLDNGVMPGSKVKIRRGENPGEVLVEAQAHRSTKEWVRTALIGADGGVVYATLKQTVETAYDDWMMIYMPKDTEALDRSWETNKIDRPPFEKIVVQTVKELAKLNPQSHVHAAEIYSAVNVVYRCPPGPILALLSSRPWYVHVGDLHFRYEDSKEN